jgi:hypothetical protein
VGYNSRRAALQRCIKAPNLIADGWPTQARFWLEWGSLQLGTITTDAAPPAACPERSRRAVFVGWVNTRDRNYCIAPPGIGMSELKMSHVVSHFPSIFFEISIHLP